LLAARARIYWSVRAPDRRNRHRAGARRVRRPRAAAGTVLRDTAGAGSKSDLAAALPRLARAWWRAQDRRLPSERWQTPPRVRRRRPPVPHCRRLEQV